MDNLHQFSLDDLIATVVRERLVDACEHEGTYVVIRQGAARFVLSPSRAHAFLRGVLKGMRARHQSRPTFDRFDTSVNPHPSSSGLDDGASSSPLVDSFRRHLLKKWWMRYEKAGSPFGPTREGLRIWVDYNTFSTDN